MRKLAPVAAVLGILAGCIATAAQAALRHLPVIYNGAAGYAHVSATASPPGANHWSCKPSAAHPRPVILVHGTFGDMSDSWQALSPLLYDHGYCVFALNYGPYKGSGRIGIYGTAPISQSAGQLGRFIARVLKASGAGQVDLVGHSQGGTMPRYYLQFLHGAAKVHSLVGLAPSNHGTTLKGLATVIASSPAAGALLANCPACREQQSGSAFMKKLNAGGDTVPGVRYTVIQSIHDEVVTPYRSAFLTGPGVIDITLQHQCGRDHGEHLSMPYDHIADDDVLTALDPAHPVHPSCTLVAPFVGG